MRGASRSPAGSAGRCTSRAGGGCRHALHDSPRSVAVHQRFRRRTGGGRGLRPPGAALRHPQQRVQHDPRALRRGRRPGGGRPGRLQPCLRGDRGLLPGQGGNGDRGRGSGAPAPTARRRSTPAPACPPGTARCRCSAGRTRTAPSTPAVSRAMGPCSRNFEVRHDLFPFGDLGAVTLLAFLDAGRVFEEESFRLTTEDLHVGGGGGVGDPDPPLGDLHLQLRRRPGRLQFLLRERLDVLVRAPAPYAAVRPRPAVASTSRSVVSPRSLAYHFRTWG